MPRPRHRRERPTVTNRYSHYRRDTERHEPWEQALITTRCNVSEYGSKPPVPVALHCGGDPHDNPRAENSFTSVQAQISDFLNGKTHGEALLHILYDHVLDE